MINYLPLVINGPRIGNYFSLLSIYITYRADSKTMKTLNQITIVPTWTSVDKLGHKAIKFTTHT